MALKIIGVILSVGMVICIILAGTMTLTEDQQGALVLGGFFLVFPLLVIVAMIWSDSGY